MTSDYNILDDKNNFSTSDDQNISEQLFELFKCDDDETELMSEKVEIISLFRACLKIFCLTINIL